MNCPHCHKRIQDALIKAEAARLSSAMRETFGAGSGRPRATERCPCGAMTKKRALLRNHVCEAR
jgi:hypothetical protein